MTEGENVERAASIESDAAPASGEILTASTVLAEAAPSVPTRILVTGTPYGGQPDRAAELAAPLGAQPRHTDETIGMDWSEQSALVATWFDAPAPWVIEGVALARALRKWLGNHPDRSEKPCDVIVLLNEPKTVLTPRQEGMRKSIATVLAEVRAELEARGVVFVAE